MEPETVALLTAVLVLATALVGLLAKLDKDVSEIHVMVNSHAKAQAERIEQLVAALRDAGLEVPDNPEHD